jgi:tetratricopeptide (TPR) repeat protein
MLLVGVCAVAGVPLLLAQSAPPPASPAPSPATSQSPIQAGSQQGNEFPEDAPKAAGKEKPVAGQKSDSRQDSNVSKPKAAGDNPFPGEDTDAPIIPVEPSPGVGPGAGAGSAGRPDSRSGSGSGSSSSGSDGTPRRDADPDGDPVRSPDGLAHTVNDDGFSSSRNGLNQMPVEDDSDARPGKSTKNKTREQVIKENLDVGGFYIDRKNWKAAQSRFASAFSLDAENPDALWGLAEAERHLQLYKEAAAHYKLLLSYDPDGPHHREARKALEEVEAASPAVSSASRLAGSENN